MNDIRFAFPKPRQSPAFTSIAIITLALGIGLNTAIFSLINDLFLKGLPFKDPARVLHLYGGDKSRDLVDIGIGAPSFRHCRDGQTVFESLAGENFFAFTLTGLGDAVQVFGGRLTSNYFDVLGVHPILGRNFLPEEEEKADVALITKNFWQKRLGGIRMFSAAASPWMASRTRSSAFCQTCRRTGLVRIRWPRYGPPSQFSFQASVTNA